MPFCRITSLGIKFLPVLDADTTTVARHFAPQQVIAGCSSGGFVSDGLYNGRLIGIEVLYGIAHTLHLQRSPDKRSDALGVIVAYRLTHIIFERTVAVGFVLMSET